jgi:dTDP-4-dehydrorhamnose 3,5-epimerase
MKVTPTRIPEILMIEPQVFGDERGFFFESFNADRFAGLTDVKVRFVQDNHSRSGKNVVRGLHYQVVRPQGKLVRVVAGAIFEVAVDLRKSSPFFGRWVGVELSAENRRQLWIPPGFAHGSVVTGEHADCLYKITDYWSPEHERTLLWSDPALGIDWPLSGPAVLSGKDKLGVPLERAVAFA